MRNLSKPAFVLSPSNRLSNTAPNTPYNMPSVMPFASRLSPLSSGMYSLVSPAWAPSHAGVSSVRQSTNLAPLLRFRYVPAPAVSLRRQPRQSLRWPLGKNLPGQRSPGGGWHRHCSVGLFRFHHCRRGDWEKNRKSCPLLLWHKLSLLAAHSKCRQQTIFSSARNFLRLL